MIHGPGGDFEVDLVAFTQAVSEQRPMVRQHLRAYGWGDRAEEVLGAVTSDLWESLARWVDLDPRPALGAWATGVARNTVRIWLRRDRPTRISGTREQAVWLEDLPVDLPASEPSSTAELEERDAAARVVAAIQARILAQPGGATRWTRLTKEVHHLVRGARAREELRAEIAQLQDAVHTRREGTP